MMTILFQNREGYVRSATHICVTYRTRNLTLRLGGSVNIPILVCLMISQTSVVIPQQVYFEHFIVVLMFNVHYPTLIGSL